MTTSASNTSLCHSETLDEISSPKFLQEHAVPTDDASIPSINFDCSICLELPHDPVVTMCGHLFCWSCLHRWITIQPIFQECPVCKACVKNKIIPLHGRPKVAGLASTQTIMDHGFDILQSHVPAAIVPQVTGRQHQSFISLGNRGGRNSMHSAAATSGLFPALFGIHMNITPLSDLASSGFSSGIAFNAESRLAAVGAQLQRLHAHQESILYWFLFLLGCLASVRFMLF